MDYGDRTTWSDDYVLPNHDMCADFKVRFFCLNSEKDCVTAEEWKHLLIDLENYLENEVLHTIFLH